VRAKVIVLFRVFAGQPSERTRGTDSGSGCGSLSLGQLEHFGLGGKEKMTDFPDIRDAGASKRFEQLLPRNGLLTERESDVLKVLLICASHFGEDQVDDTWAQPTRLEDDIHLAE